MESIDEHFVRMVRATGPSQTEVNPAVLPGSTAEATTLRELFDAQVQSRHLDFAARWLQGQGGGYYTIGSAGHESNAAVGLLSRVDDPALLHYRSGGFYAARAARAGTTDPVRDVLLSLTSSTADPMSGGRHKVFGHPALHIIPQTSTISSHLPRAVGLAYALTLAADSRRTTPWPADSVVLCSFGDASANHSTATGALNTAAYLAHRDLSCPILFVCEDNGIGISTRSPGGWPEASWSRLPGIAHWSADGAEPQTLLATTGEALDMVRKTRRPGLLHLRTVRFMGHAGSDAEIAYRSREEIVADYARDPLLATARTLITAGAMSPDDVLDRYQAARESVMAEARRVLDAAHHLSSSEAITAPLALPPHPRQRDIAVPHVAGRTRVWADRLPEHRGALTLAQSVNVTLIDLMATSPELLVFGEDVAVKGGVYGVTRGLRKQFGARRVFDTVLDEQTILGVALGAALAGFVPFPEIQYLAYLHNAEDQLRGEAASLRFFSNGQYHNGMVVRIAGLAYQQGFGGHFHNDNSVAVLRDIPGLVLAVPAHPADAPGLLRACFELARDDGRVCVFLEPIARYHTKDLLVDGDGLWTSPYVPPDAPDAVLDLHKVRRYGSGSDILLVTFGNGVHLSLRASSTLAQRDVETSVVDLRWLAPLPIDALVDIATDFGAILVVDETRRSGGVAEAVVTGLVEAGYDGRLARVTSADSFVPLGPAARHVLLSEDDIVCTALDLIGDRSSPSPRKPSPESS